MVCQRWSVHSKGDSAKIKFFSAHAEGGPCFRLSGDACKPSDRALAVALHNDLRLVTAPCAMVEFLRPVQSGHVQQAKTSVCVYRKRPARCAGYGVGVAARHSWIQL